MIMAVAVVSRAIDAGVTVEWGVARVRAMPRPNTQVVAALYAAFNAGDVDSALAYADPDIEWIPADGSPFEQAYRGREQVKRFLEQEWMGVFDDLQGEVRELVYAPDDAVLATLHLTGRGGASGVELDFEIAHLWRLHEGVVVQVQAFTHREQALEAAGLQDPPAS
jgi:ketosteroid isomerase-like protein